MGQMKRAEERERLLRTKLTRTYRVVIQWRRDDDVLLLNVLDPGSHLPITRRRIIRNPQSIVEMINRSLTPLRPGPRQVTFLQKLTAGRGDLEIEITAEQYAQVTHPRNAGPA